MTALRLSVSERCYREIERRLRQVDGIGVSLVARRGPGYLLLDGIALAIETPPPPAPVVCEHYWRPARGDRECVKCYILERDL